MREGLLGLLLVFSYLLNIILVCLDSCWYLMYTGVERNSVNNIILCSSSQTFFLLLLENFLKFDHLDKALHSLRFKELIAFAEYMNEAKCMDVLYAVSASIVSP